MKTIGDRPLYNNLPVPYVARWTKEIAQLSFSLRATGAGVQSITYGDDETPFDRDQRGVLWLRENPFGNGQGVPEFGSVSSYRQRQCITEGRCQICGERIKSPFLFLMVPDQMRVLDYSGLTENPPLCEQCYDAAPLWCPALKHSNFSRLSVEKIIPDAYLGEVAFYQTNGSMYRQIQSVGFDKERFFPVLLARQLSARLEGIEHL